MLQRRQFVIVGLYGTCIASGMPILLAKEPAKKLDLAKEVDTFARSLRIDATTLLTQSDVRKMLAHLETSGWKPRDAASIVGAALPDRHLMVQKLRSPRGRAFAARVAALPMGFDRVEHLSRLSDGGQLLDRLIDGPDGEKLIDYLVNADGGRELGTMLSGVPGGVDFNKPTGHIYTLKQLVDRLERDEPPPIQMPNKRR